MKDAIFFTGGEAPLQIQIIEPIQRDDFYINTTQGYMIAAGIFPASATDEINAIWAELQEIAKLKDAATAKIYKLRNSLANASSK